MCVSVDGWVGRVCVCGVNQCACKADSISPVEHKQQSKSLKIFTEGYSRYYHPIHTHMSAASWQPQPSALCNQLYHCMLDLPAFVCVQAHVWTWDIAVHLTSNFLLQSHRNPAAVSRKVVVCLQMSQKWEPGEKSCRTEKRVVHTFQCNWVFLKLYSGKKYNHIHRNACNCFRIILQQKFKLLLLWILTTNKQAVKQFTYWEWST